VNGLSVGAHRISRISSKIRLDIAFLHPTTRFAMPEHMAARSIDARLDNWASANRGSYDSTDAARIERAWRRLAVRQRDLLRMAYLWRAGREVICRRLGIPRHPWCRYEFELASAKQALASLLMEKS
jgi:hypothetical protein